MRDYDQADYDHLPVDDQLKIFEEKHGYPWPNCAVADCEYKACVPSEFCWLHTSEDVQRQIRPEFFEEGQ